jgi:hypothetical protein
MHVSGAMIGVRPILVRPAAAIAHTPIVLTAFRKEKASGG